jgi:hypothetical protein
MHRLEAPAPQLATTAGDSPARRSVFPLLRYFSLASLVAIVVVTITLALAYERLAERDLIKAQEHHHVTLTRVTAHALWPRFSEFMRAFAELDAAALRSRPETAQLYNAVVKELAGTPVLKVKVYDLAGRTAFSTETGQIGEDKSKNAGFLSARAGTPASELTHRNHFSAFRPISRSWRPVPSWPCSRSTATSRRCSAASVKLARP